MTLSVLPRLAIDRDEPPHCGGRMERLNLAPIPPGRNADRAFCESLGACIGLLSWLGATDLHAENILFGVDASGRILWCPVDLECLFHRVELPSQTHLTPSESMPRERCGLFSVAIWLRQAGPEGAAAAVVQGYDAALRFLEPRRKDFLRLMMDHRLGEATVRVISRPTKEYAAALTGSGASRASAFSPCEKEQLDRGDFPYYFRRADSRELFYYRGPDLRAEPAMLDRTVRDRAGRLSLTLEEWSAWTPPRLADLGSLQLLRFLTGS